MTRTEFESKARERIKIIINYISQGRYNELSSIILIKSSWCGKSETQEEGIRSFGEWITGQLALWSEDYEKEFVVDRYNEECLDSCEFIEEQIFATYSPTSHGEKIDFWFEINVHMNDENVLISEFNVNM